MEFTFSVDQLVKQWYSTKYTIEADSLEEANRIILEKYKDGSIDRLPTEGWSPIDFSQDLLQPSENEGKSTEMLIRMENGYCVDILHENGN
jgi:hypothetical protein